MAEAILMKGGGTVYSEDCTAVATDILGPCTVSGHEADAKTALFNGSNDEIKPGTMANRQWHNTAVPSSSVWISGSSVRATGLVRAYYGSDSTVSIPITTATFGNAVASQVLSGASFLLANTTGTKTVTTGTMPNYAGVSKTGGAGDKPSTNIIRIKIANTGYYNTNSYVQTALSNFGNNLGTAGRGHVLKDITFTSTAGVATSGTMPNHNGTSTNTATAFSSGGSLWIKSLSSSGYYTSSTSVKTNIPVYSGSTS